MVGLSATLSHCYPNVKRITKILRELFPDIWIVVGGHLTGSANVILNKTETGKVENILIDSQSPLFNRFLLHNMAPVRPKITSRNHLRYKIFCILSTITYGTRKTPTFQKQ